jgi:hypothetical protein
VVNIPQNVAEHPKFEVDDVVHGAYLELEQLFPLVSCDINIDIVRNNCYLKVEQLIRTNYKTINYQYKDRNKISV